MVWVRDPAVKGLSSEMLYLSVCAEAVCMAAGNIDGRGMWQVIIEPPESKTRSS
jgi:hypothetical protein